MDYDDARGLALEFARDTYDLPVGRDDGYVRGAPDPARMETLHVAGMARDYSLEPGEGIEIPVLLAAHLDRLPAGEYALEATMRGPSLKAHGAVLRISTTTRSK